ncbi:hypothetical protein [Spiroplasma chrysopicola]|uniref:Uncharacterized protein n=1 Tax=Spiroplasma chrysopicola DF-1 TaxID=1276227 RepID=R4U1G8_9MOLU|nr:hypothetical protein [Spiroplasma chrysopicola]AGM25147.1 hypothetical protein SCHRY_v1c05690 [Spiroplasma chrysopicola DF-1]
MKSHIFPQSLLKKIFLKYLNNKNFGIAKIDLSTGEYNFEIINSDNDLNIYVNDNDNFYLNLDIKQIKKYEEDWNLIEQPYIEKVSTSAKKIIENSINLSNDSLSKKLNYLLKDKYKIIYNFIRLCIFRSYSKGSKIKIAEVCSNTSKINKKNW